MTEHRQSPDRHRRRRRDPARRPGRADVLGEHQRRPLQHQRRRRRSAGTPRCTTTPTRSAPDKTYSKIGGWVREYDWDPLRVAAADAAEGRRRRWTTARSGRSPAPARRCSTTAGRTGRSTPSAPPSILGNAMAASKHYLTALRIHFPEFARDLERRADASPRCPATCARRSPSELHERIRHRLPEITEDTHARRAGATASPAGSRTCSTSAGPNFIVDAACASGAGRASTPPIEGLVERRVRRRRHRRRRPQHGRQRVREVLQDRRAVGHRHPARTTTAPTAS